MGIVSVRAPVFWSALRPWRKPALAAALLSYACVLILFHDGSFGTGAPAQVLASFVWRSNGWLWMLALCGWAQYLLNRESAVVKYLNGGVYCYYILHQTVIIMSAYTLAPFELGPALEPVLLVMLTIAACLCGYEVLRRVPGLRLLFGISAPPIPELRQEAAGYQARESP